MRQEELEQYIREYGKDLYSFCRSVTWNLEEAQDLYQDTFLKLYEIGDRLVTLNNPKSYLMGIALNLYRNEKRKLSAVQSLADKYRLPVLLFYIEELSLSEIASVLRLPEGTVKSRLHRAKRILQQMLMEKQEGAEGR